MASSQFSGLADYKREMSSPFPTIPEYVYLKTYMAV